MNVARAALITLAPRRPLGYLPNDTYDVATLDVRLGNEPYPVLASNLQDRLVE